MSVMNSIPPIIMSCISGKETPRRIGYARTRGNTSIKPNKTMHSKARLIYIYVIKKLMPHSRNVLRGPIFCVD